MSASLWFLSAAHCTLRTVAAIDQPAELLYPFYLDTDMSMAFAAALAGGVALESEQLARVEDASRAVRSLRSSLRLFGVGGVDAGGSGSVSSGTTTEATLVRRHTAHSVFIDLYEELRSTGRLVAQPKIEDLKVGALVSMQLQPAVAPLRRVIEQILRLLDVMAPMLGSFDDPEPAPVSRQDRRQRAREAAKGSEPSSEEESGLDALRGMRQLCVALRDDLEHSGMIDVVVAAEEGPGIVLTLDKRFADQTTLELLHTSNFTVVGKVTHLWPRDDDVVLLYRRSVISLVPALGQQVAVGVLGFLIALAKSIGTVEVQEVVDGLVGQSSPESEAHEGPPTEDAGDAPTSGDEVADASATAASDEDDVRVGNDVAALHPALTGPAAQVLPLALCI